MRNIISYDALMILWDTIQKDRHKFKEWGSEKNDMNLYFETSRTSAMEIFAKIFNG